MALLDLPNELLLAVAFFLDCPFAINALVRTNRQLYTLLNPYLYRHNILEDESSGLVVAQFPKHRTLTDPSAVRHRDLHEYYHRLQPSAPDGLPISLTPDILALDRTIGLFVEHGASLEHRYQHSKYTDLHLAASGRHEHLFFLLIKHGADINALGYPLSKTTLHFAAAGGCIRIMRFLIEEKHMDVNAQDKQGETPLHCAVAAYREAAIRLLVDNGADLHTCSSGFTPLHALMKLGGRAYREEWLATLRALLELGADLEARSEGEGWTPLIVAVIAGSDLDLVHALLEHGAQIEARSADGTTTLHAAVEEGNLDIAKALLKRGANINSRKDNGQLMLFTAIERPLDAHIIVPRLVELGADVNATIGNGIEKTVLQHLEDEGLTGLLEGQQLVATGH